MILPRLSRTAKWRAPLLIIGALLLLARFQSQGQTYCEFYDIANGESQYVLLDDRFTGGEFDWYDSNSCDNVGGQLDLDGHGLADADDEAHALEICNANLRGANTVSPDTNAYVPNFYWICHNKPPRSRSKSRGGASFRAPVVPTAIPTPTGILLNQTGLRLSAVDGLESGIEFQRVDGAGVGIRAVIELGILDAIDVWANIGAGYTVCFPRPGRVIFLDAATMPRTASEIDHFVEDGFTCVSETRAGTMVLVPSAEEPPDQAAEYEPGLSPDYTPPAPLENCRITTLQNLHLRDAPLGESQGLVPIDTALSPSQRTFSWYAVEFEGRAGWISAWFVDAEGECKYVWPGLVGGEDGSEE